MDLRIDCWTPTDTEIHTDNYRIAENFRLDDEDEKRWLNKTAGSPIFDFSLRQGLEPR
uniref:Uncharacterized protein n=1 Tax=Amphimedon queenslandica TaxID=400682 RepID=A0A1X7UVQ8_AMPQE